MKKTLFATMIVALAAAAPAAPAFAKHKHHHHKSMSKSPSTQGVDSAKDKPGMAKEGGGKVEGPTQSDGAK